MGKVAKKRDGKPSLIQFKDDKSISLVVEGDKVKLVEIGLMDMEVGTICTKDIRLYESLVEVLLKCQTIGEARIKANMVKLQGESNEETAPASSEGPPYARNKPLSHWEDFKSFAVSLYPAITSVPLKAPDAKEAVREATCAYLDKMNQNHKEVVAFVEKLDCHDPLRAPKDRIWVFKDMYLKTSRASGSSQSEDDLRAEFCTYVKGLRSVLGRQFYQPTDYPSDFDAAEELLHAAENYWNMGKPVDAVSMAEQAIGAAVNCIDAYYLVAEFHILEQNFAAAADALARISEMPLADQVLPNRPDYFVLFAKLCKKIPEKDICQQHQARLKALAEKYQISAEQLAA